jgi:alkyl hydroperoxide reductase subunit AhpC
MNNPAFTKKAVRRATAQEFEAALIGRSIKPDRRDAAYRMIVLGEKAREVAEALGMKRDNVNQAVWSVFGIIERYRLTQLNVTRYVGRGLDDAVSSIDALQAELVVLSQALEAGALVASLRKSAESLRGAADELRPHL